MKVERLQRRELECGSLKLSYYDEETGAVPVVFQHGLCGSVVQTAEAFPEDERLRLVTLECRGHGASAPGATQELSIAHFADDVVALIESLRLAPVILGGISMGAAIATRIAVRRPNLVRALVLVRPAWVSEAAPANMQPNAEVGDLLARSGPDEARAMFERGATARRLANEAPDNLVSLLGFFDRKPHAVTAALLRRISADGPGVTPGDLRALAVPALVIGHRADAVHPMAHAHSLAGLLARSEFVEITPKSVSREAYIKDLHAAIVRFVDHVPHSTNA